jgi:hypothetical protein
VRHNCATIFLLNVAPVDFGGRHFIVGQTRPALFQHPLNSSARADSQLEIGKWHLLMRRSAIYPEEDASPSPTAITAMPKIMGVENEKGHSPIK